MSRVFQNPLDVADRGLTHRTTGLLITDPKVSVILPTYNRAGVIEFFLEFCLRQTEKDLELIVVDDGSSDDTEIIVRKHMSSDSRIRYVRIKSCSGLPHARNVGLLHARGEYIYMGEDDTIMDNRCLEILLATFKALRSRGIRVGAVGPRIVRPSSIATGVFCDELKTPVVIGRFTKDKFMNWRVELSSTLKVPSLHACILAPRALFDEVGYYDERYIGNYWREEDDLYFRMANHGYELFFEPCALVTHLIIRSGGVRKNSFWKTTISIHVNHLLLLLKFYKFTAFLRFIAFATQFLTLWLLEYFAWKTGFDSLSKVAMKIKLSKANNGSFSGYV